MEIKISTRRDLKGKGLLGRDGGVGDGGGNGNGSPGSAVPARMRAMGKRERQTEADRESSADMWRDLTTLEHG